MWTRGRRITSSGQRDLDQVAGRIAVAHWEKPEGIFFLLWMKFDSFWVWNQFYAWSCVGHLRRDPCESYYCVCLNFGFGESFSFHKPFLTIVIRTMNEDATPSAIPLAMLASIYFQEMFSPSGQFLVNIKRQVDGWLNPRIDSVWRILIELGDVLTDSYHFFLPLLYLFSRKEKLPTQ